MSENKHTPGPWKASEPDDFGDIAIGKEDGGLAIAAVVNGEFLAMGGKEAEHNANALLIAAAPELLEAIRLYEVYDAMPSDRGGRNGPRGKAYQAFVDAKDAALAKAGSRP